MLLLISWGDTVPQQKIPIKHIPGSVPAQAKKQTSLSLIALTHGEESQAKLTEEGQINIIIIFNLYK
jgi:hypothetical protein